jgi:hypothetical protein
MSFNKIFKNLIVEYSADKNHIYTKQELSNYALFILEDNKKLAQKAYDYLNKSEWSKKGCRVVVRPVPTLEEIPTSSYQRMATSLPLRQLYYILYPINFGLDDIKKIASDLDKHLINGQRQFSISVQYPAVKNIADIGGITDYDPLDEYNLDDETKQAWGDVISEL